MDLWCEERVEFRMMGGEVQVVIEYGCYVGVAVKVYMHISAVLLRD